MLGPFVLAAFVLTSPDFTDNAIAPIAGAQSACGGGTSTSPGLTWSGAPQARKALQS